MNNQAPTQIAKKLLKELLCTNINLDDEILTYEMTDKQKEKVQIQLDKIQVRLYNKLI